jgi:L-rhamnose-H+ transport protein
VETNLVLGLSLAIFAGILQGTILLPMKLVRTWKWENTWFVFSGCGYCVLPWLFAAMSVPSLARVYGDVEFGPLLLTSLFGLGWGISAILFGLGCDTVGMAVGFAVILGLGTSLGSLVPLVILHPDKVLQPQGIKIVAGTVVMVAGVVVCSWAGKFREDAARLQGSTEWSKKRYRFKTGMVLCLLSGLLNPLINFGLAFGSKLTEAAIKFGAKKESAPNLVWALIATAGFIPNATYCIYLLRKNQSTHLFWQDQRKALNLFLAVLMGLIWIGGIVAYGRSTVYLGELGPSVGWPIFMGCLIISSNLWGVVTGEWRVGGSKPIATMCVGLALLIAAVYVIS